MEVARAEAEKIKLIGASDASAIECVGKAEAEMMRLKAAAYKQYGKAATLSLVLDALPKVCLLSSFLFSVLTYKLKQYGKAATLGLMLDSLPKVWLLSSFLFSQILDGALCRTFKVQ